MWNLFSSAVHFEVFSVGIRAKHLLSLKRRHNSLPTWLAPLSFHPFILALPLSPQPSLHKWTLLFWHFLWWRIDQWSLFPPLPSYLYYVSPALSKSFINIKIIFAISQSLNLSSGLILQTMNHLSFSLCFLNTLGTNFLSAQLPRLFIFLWKQVNEICVTDHLE